MKRMPAARWLRADAGSVIPIVAVVLAALAGVAAFSLDYGLLFNARRRLQGAADLAALVAAQAPANAAQLARLSLADNGLSAPTALSVITGIYTPAGTRPPSDRFVPGATPANAVQVRVSSTAPLVFGRVVSGRDALPVDATATATRADLAVVSIGSRLASVQGGVANALLGGLLGVRLSLAATDYQSLASARIDAFAFLDALAAGLDLRAGTYADVLSASATLAQTGSALARAGRDSQSADPTAVAALRSIADALAGNPTLIPIGQIVKLGSLDGMAVGTSAPGHALLVGPMAVLSGAAAVATGGRQVQIDLTSAIPGVLDAKLSIQIGDRAQSVAGPVGPGTIVRTAQTRIALETRIAAPVGLGQLYFPIFVQAASADATLTGLTCPWSSPDQMSATLSARPGLLDTAVAAPPAGWALGVGGAADVSRPATILDLPLLTVRGQARVTAAAPSSRELVFAAADIAAGRVRTVGTTGIAGSVATSLVNGLSLDVDGFSPSAPALRGTLAATLAAVTPGLDGALDSTLAVLGVGLGQADVWVDSVHCVRTVLVQ